MRKTMTLAEVDPLILQCVQLHNDLMAAGLYITGHKMHEVVRSVGWEVANNLPRAVAPFSRRRS